MATIFKFICHDMRFLRKWPKGTIGSTSAAPGRLTCPEKSRQREIRWYWDNEKKVQNSMSSKIWFQVSIKTVSAQSLELTELAKLCRAAFMWMPIKSFAAPHCAARNLSCLWNALLDVPSAIMPLLGIRVLIKDKMQWNASRWHKGWDVQARLLKQQ